MSVRTDIFTLICGHSFLFSLPLTLYHQLSLSLSRCLSLTLSLSPSSLLSLSLSLSFPLSFLLSLSLSSLLSLSHSLSHFLFNSQGYHFIDIPLLNVSPIALPTSRRMRQFLTDFDEPRRFLEIEDFKDLDSEPCGELDVSIQQIGAGGDSKFLPEVSTYVSILYIMIN